jgi:hypothetical protein
VPNLFEPARDAMNPVAGGIVGLPGVRSGEPPAPASFYPLRFARFVLPASFCPLRFARFVLIDNLGVMSDFAA